MFSWFRSRREMASARRVVQFNAVLDEIAGKVDGGELDVAQLTFEEREVFSMLVAGVMSTSGAVESLVARREVLDAVTGVERLVHERYDGISMAARRGTSV